MLRHLTLNQAVLLQNLIGLGFWVKSVIFLCDLKCRDAARRNPECPCSQHLDPLSRCLPASSQGCLSFPRRLVTVLPSPVAPGQPQRTKANACPVLTSNFMGTEILHQQFIYRKLGKVFGTHPSVLWRNCWESSLLSDISEWKCLCPVHQLPFATPR